MSHQPINVTLVIWTKGAQRERGSVGQGQLSFRCHLFTFFLVNFFCTSPNFSFSFFRLVCFTPAPLDKPLTDFTRERSGETVLAAASTPTGSTTQPTRCQTALVSVAFGNIYGWYKLFHFASFWIIYGWLFHFAAYCTDFPTVPTHASVNFTHQPLNNSGQVSKKL